MKISITVYGKALAKGSVRPFMSERKDGSTFHGVKPQNPKLKAWEQAVRVAGVEAMDGRDLLREPVTASMLFHFARPKGHYGTGRNADKLKPSAPKIHDQNPDLDKLTRAVFDALSGTVFDDDRRVCEYREPFGKHWTEGAERAEITIETKSDDKAAEAKRG